MKECSKSIPRRLANSNFLGRYFKGHGIDIGGAPDPLSLYQELFPLIKTIRVWDRPDGDAQYLEGVDDEIYDFVHSSHCLEHLHDPYLGIRNWFRVLKPGGYLVVTVPDEDLYEQGMFPSTFNHDHKSTFTIYKVETWSPRSVSVLPMLQGLGPQAAIEAVQLINGTYRYAVPRFDQTLTPIAEAAIEMIVRKRDADEVATRGLMAEAEQPVAAIRTHFNQYRDDHAEIRKLSAKTPPFTNDNPL